MTMSDEGLLRRWSRRKQAAQAAAAPAHEVVVPVAPELPTPELPTPELPTIESLGSASDYTAFLQKGVTAEVQRLALQRAWQSDESIAGFRGMAEYAWDFNAPQYGDLWATDDVAKLLQAVLTPPPEEPPVAVADLIAEPEPLDPAGTDQIESASAKPPASPAAEPEPAQQEVGIRRHGSALPS